MRLRKKPAPEKPSGQQALEARVDAMMDPKRPDEMPAVAPPPPPAAATSDVKPSAAATKTAPKLSAKLRKQIAVTDAEVKKPAPPAPPKVQRAATAAPAIREPQPLPEPQQSEPQPDQQTEPQDEPAPETDPTERSVDLDDSRTDEAVDDITHYESDVVLAVADATAAEHVRQTGGDEPVHPVHHIFSTFVWTLVFLTAVIAVVLFVLLVTGGNVSGLQR